MKWLEKHFNEEEQQFIKEYCLDSYDDLMVFPMSDIIIGKMAKLLNDVETILEIQVMLRELIEWSNTNEMAK